MNSNWTWVSARVLFYDPPPNQSFERGCESQVHNDLGFAKKASHISVRVSQIQNSPQVQTSRKSVRVSRQSADLVDVGPPIGDNNDPLHETLHFVRVWSVFGHSIGEPLHVTLHFVRVSLVVCSDWDVFPIGYYTLWWCFSDQDHHGVFCCPACPTFGLHPDTTGTSSSSELALHLAPLALLLSESLSKPTGLKGGPFFFFTPESDHTHAPRLPHHVAAPPQYASSLHHVRRSLARAREDEKK